VIAVTLARPWLVATLPRPMRVLSWAPVNPGFHIADRIVWREVRNADLPAGFDAEAWFARDLAAAGHGECVGLLTSRDVGMHHVVRTSVEGVAAACLATVGLSNGESVGRRLPAHAAEYGTINLAVAVGAGLAEAAQVELLSVAVQARTAAVMAAGIGIATGTVTGTGTDCVALACDDGPVRFAGLHTAVGEAVGACVRAAVTAGVAEWLAEREAFRATAPKN